MDVDVLVVLRGPFALYPEIKRVARVQLDLLLRHEELVSFVLVPEDRAADPMNPLMMNVRAEGIDL